jgi:hypothetical protein
MNKITYCTLDTETVGGACGNNDIYNLSGIVHDREGNYLATFNFIVAEHFNRIDEAFYGKKTFHRYGEMLAKGEITVIPTEAEAISIVNSLLNFYNVKYVMAFNTAFDYTKTNCSVLLEGREFIDIQLMAMQIFGGRKSYSDFCHANNFRSKGKGTQCASSAEAYFAFISNDPTFEEEHTAFADSSIEVQIFVACLKAHKKFTKNCHWYDFGGKWKLVRKW